VRQAMARQVLSGAHCAGRRRGWLLIERLKDFSGNGQKRNEIRLDEQKRLGYGEEFEPHHGRGHFRFTFGLLARRNHFAKAAGMLPIERAAYSLRKRLRAKTTREHRRPCHDLHDRPGTTHDCEQHENNEYAAKRTHRMRLLRRPRTHVKGTEGRQNAADLDRAFVCRLSKSPRRDRRYAGCTRVLA
jgi:hypothetical protein